MMASCSSMSMVDVLRGGRGGIEMSRATGFIAYLNKGTDLRPAMRVFMDSVQIEAEE
jgi:hypothetical protein